MRHCLLLGLLISLLLGCKKRMDPLDNFSEQQFLQLRSEIVNLPSSAQVAFFQIKPDSLRYKTACFVPQVSYENPYVIANGQRFHALNWRGSQHIFDSNGRTIIRAELRFDPE